MKSNNARNGKIELWRFVFCIIIILFHCMKTFGVVELQTALGQIRLFIRGYFGVEFFFLVTGYLTAASIVKKRARVYGDDAAGGASPVVTEKGECPGEAGKSECSGEAEKRECSGEVPEERAAFDLGKESWNFFLKKYFGVFPYHAFAFGILIVVRIFTREIWRSGFLKTIGFLFESIPEFFLLQRFGFSYTNIDVVEWYISAMLIALLFLYPIAFRFYSMYVHVIGPLAALWILGVIYYIHGTFSGQDVWTGFGYVCVFRAVSEITLGMCMYEAACALRKMDLSARQRALLTGMEAFGFVIACGYALTDFDNRFEPHMLLFLSASVALAFSGQTYGNEWFQKEWIFFLGRYSLPLYLCQLIGIGIVNKYIKEPPFFIRAAIVMG
ncbi:MAG: acyltransferase, partial [Lachnospiraceae bacterium]|nr:acyltransferase [Lachnospiraceae bacterium]